MLQEYPGRMRLQRQLYGIYSDVPLTFKVHRIFMLYFSGSFNRSKLNLQILETETFIKFAFFEGNPVYGINHCYESSK